LDEKDLTPKQRKWLEASRKIGSGAMTKTERQTLERLYADMLPAEQQGLQRYIQEQFGKKKDEPGSKPSPPDPTELMERRVWTPPSDGLRRAFAKPASKSRTSGEDHLLKESEQIRRLRSRVGELLSRGVQFDLERIEQCIARVEGLQEDLEDLRGRTEETGRMTGMQEIQDKEKELDQAEKELKKLIEPVSDLLV